MNDDLDWAKNLSRASFHAGKWALSNEFDVRRQAQKKRNFAADRLITLATDALHLFNENLSEDEGGIQILRIADANAETKGFLLLYGKSQIKAECVGGGIRASLIHRVGYDTRLIDATSYICTDDGLGCIQWFGAKNETITDLGVVKELFLRLVKCERSGP